MSDETREPSDRGSDSRGVSELSFLGPSNDGNRLLLESKNGDRFELPVDSRLIAVVSREYRERVTAPSAPPTQLPTPREIQDRIRHGENVDDLAASVGADVSDIAKFASPVITERAHIANLAQQSFVSTGTGHRPLIDVVMDRLSVRGIDVQATLWDAWRRPDDRWTVVIAYPVSRGSQVATFVYSVEDKLVDAADDGARWLLEVPSETTQDPPITSNTPHPKPADPEPPKRSTEPSTPSNGKANWDKEHPAARAAQRRETPTPKPAPPKLAASPGLEEAVSEAEAPQDSPQWEELLFGTPRDDK